MLQFPNPIYVEICKLDKAVALCRSTPHIYMSNQELARNRYLHATNPLRACGILAAHDH